ncbi:MAG: ComEA family DNA-binding protein [Bacteroidota bacterium]
MKRNLIISSLAALSVAFLLPMGAHAATTTATTAKHHAVAKSATATKATTTKNASAAKTDAATPAKAATATKKHHHRMAKNASASKKIDVNSATKDELMTLPGMDSDTADKIIAGRPYKNMTQLKSKGGVSAAEYKKLRTKVTAKQSTEHSEAPASGAQSSDNAASQGGNTTPSGSTDNTTK